MRVPPRPYVVDVVLVGGGLQNALCALALRRRRPALRLALVERGPTIGGNHTWCFHAGDVPAPARGFVEPLVVRRWPGYDVVFPGLRRSFDAPYSAVTSERVHAVVGEAFAGAAGSLLLLGTDAVAVEARRVRLADGTELRADLVVDARGPGRLAPGRAGHQKFVGLELALRAPHGIERPVLMDATVAQRGGFRFMYALPFDERRILVEDTTFSRDPSLDEAACRRAIRRWVGRRGLAIDRIVREERGVLPMPWAGGVDDRPGPLRAGYAGGWFHPATGYSFPAAVRLALHVATRPPAGAFDEAFRRLVAEQRRQARFAHLLNRLLFHLFAPEDMWNVFERFHRLPEPVIRRFYALRLTTKDRARLLLGRPPRGLSPRAAFLGRST